MAGSARRRWGLLGVTGVGYLALLPGVASAHGVTTSRFQAPLPLPWLFAGAAATVALTALWLGYSERAGNAADTEPAESATDAGRTGSVTDTGRMGSATDTGRTGSAMGNERTLVAVPTSIVTRARLVASVLFLALVVGALVAGVVGRQVASGNLATVFTWPVWFRGLAIVAILVGNPWVTIAPWRVVYRALSHLEGRSITLLGEYPRRLASWAAVIGFLVLVGVVENLTVIPRSPRLTSGLVAGYAMVMVGGAVLFGRTWFERADPLGVLYRLFGRVAPLRLADPDGDGHRLLVRPPWLGCLDPVRSMSIVVFAVATVYTVSFDGFTNTRLFQTVLFAVRDALGTGPETSVGLYVAGIAGFVVTFGLFAWIADRLGEGSGQDWTDAARWFAPTILPIAAAYEIAHNYPYVLRNAGQLVEVLLDPLLPGVGPVQPLSWLSVPGFWASQVVLIVLGHVIAVVAAHHVAVRRYGSIGAARRGHLPLVALLIAYTVLSLWIVSRPVVAA